MEKVKERGQRVSSHFSLLDWVEWAREKREREPCFHWTFADLPRRTNQTFTWVYRGLWTLFLLDCSLLIGQMSPWTLTFVVTHPSSFFTSLTLFALFFPWSTNNEEGTKKKAGKWRHGYGCSEGARLVTFSFLLLLLGCSFFFPLSPSRPNTCRQMHICSYHASCLFLSLLWKIHNNKQDAIPVTILAGKSTNSHNTQSLKEITSLLRRFRHTHI